MDKLWKRIPDLMIQFLCLFLLQPNSNYRPDLADRDFIFPRNTGIREATLVLIKEKSNRFHLVRVNILIILISINFCFFFWKFNQGVCHHVALLLSFKGTSAVAEVCY